MGELATVFSDDTRRYIHDKARVLRGQDRRDFIEEAEKEVWDFGLFDLGDVKRIINTVLNRYIDN